MGQEPHSPDATVDKMPARTATAGATKNNVYVNELLRLDASSCLASAASRTPSGESIHVKPYRCCKCVRSYELYA